MAVAGIVAEYNPFHTGHQYQIAETRRRLGEESAVVAVMSGHWVQQADCAVADKWARARLALQGGVDLVLELPTVWAAASAEAFARGAAALLHGAGVVTHLSFGSECGVLEPLAAAADCLDSPLYRAGLHRFLDEGMSFPAARQAAVREILGAGADVLSGPNNNLGVEYLRALASLRCPIAPITVMRRGAGHNQVGTGDAGAEFCSATDLRMRLRTGDWDGLRPYLAPGGETLLQGQWACLPSLDRVERAMLARVRIMSAPDWARLPDAGEVEGLPRRMARAGRQCRSMEELYALVKTKRYTHARLRRLVLWAFLGLTAGGRTGESALPPGAGVQRPGQGVVEGDAGQGRSAGADKAHPCQGAGSGWPAAV